MPRPKSPCGTYPAYQRHLREKTPVDDACRRAQQRHDADRGRRHRSTDADRPVVSIPTAAPASPREMLRRCAVDLLEFVDDGYLYGVDDLMSEMTDLLAEWQQSATAEELAVR